MSRIMMIPLAAAVMLGASCSHKSTPQEADRSDVPQAVTRPLLGGSVAAMPKATVFRMNGDYADNVAVTLNPDGTLLYYPAPTDITENSSPVSLGDGWWLNRQGVSGGSVFTDWTFAEYSSLKKTPSQKEIMAHIIPGSGIVRMLTLPMSVSEAISDPQKCLRFIPSADGGE